MRIAPQPVLYLFTIYSSPCRILHEPERRLVVVGFVPSDSQNGDGQLEGRPLVALDERMEVGDVVDGAAFEKQSGQYSSLSQNPSIAIGLIKASSRPLSRSSPALTMTLWWIRITRMTHSR